ncbi:MAG: SRPBCC family protein [Bacteroidaceae bacterium]|nr:SRPBCC family protein [Bacteroidaceae bacterium]
MDKFESSIKEIPYSQEGVYEKLSDMKNLEAIKDKIPQDKIKEMVFDDDSFSVNIPPAGTLTFKIVDREPYKCIKFEAIKAPLPFKLWIQLMPLSENSCKMKITASVEANPFIKKMIAKPLSEGVEKMADMLSMIHY